MKTEEFQGYFRREVFNMEIIFLLIIIAGLAISYSEKYKNKNRNKNKNDKIGSLYNEFDDIDDYANTKKKKQEMQQLEKEFSIIQNMYQDSENYNPEQMEKFKKDTRFLYAHANNNKGKNQQEIKEGNTEVLIRENNKEFDTEVFKNWAVQLFGYMQTATAEDIVNIKPVVGSSIYSNKKNQLDLFKRDGIVLKKDEVFINNAKLLDYFRDTKYEYIQMYVDMVCCEYIEHIKTKEVVKGDKKKKKRKYYIVTFKKRREDKDFGRMHETNCPNCGAALTDVFFGKCDYCGTLITTIRHSWRLEKIELA